MKTINFVVLFSPNNEKNLRSKKFKLADTLTNVYPEAEDILRHSNNNIKVVDQRTSLTKITGMRGKNYSK